MMQRLNKQVSVVVAFLICMLLSSGNVVLATEEGSSGVVINEGTEVNNSDEIIDSVDRPVESNFTSKAYYIDGEDRNNYLVEGGNEDAVNMMAKEQSTAGGTVTENINIDGEPYDMTLPTDEDFEEKDPLELRQFITFETKSGKVFHIIIDHGKDSDNVMMLTEVSEQDLLNLIEAQADVEIGIIEDEVELPQDEPADEKESESDISESIGTESSEEPADYSLIMIAGVAAVSGIAGWYFKIYKPKKTAAFEDEVDEADYIDDDELINEDYE